MSKKVRELIEQPLFETINILTEEDASDNEFKLLTITGTASKGGFVNKNERLYPTPVLNKAAEKAQDLIRRGKLLGEVDHPDMTGSLSRAAVKFNKLFMEGDEMKFIGDVLPTESGKHLALLLQAGVGVGISTRGYGTVKEVELGEQTVYEVQPDYELKGIDCVLDESNQYGKVANFESNEGGTVMELTLETLKEEYPEIFEAVKQEVTESIEKELTKNFEEKVNKQIESKRKEFIAKAKKEFMESEEVKQQEEVLATIIEAVKPLIPEALTKEEVDEELAKTNESLETKVTELEKDLQEAKDKYEDLENKLNEEKQAKATEEKINELVENHKYEKALRKRLVICTTPEEVKEAFDSEVEYINSLVEGSKIPKGKGVQKDKDEKDEKQDLDEAKARQRRLAGIIKEDN